MDSIKIGRIVLLAIVIGIAIGGYRWWQGRHGGSTGGDPGLSIVTLFGNHGRATSGSGANSGGSANPGDVTVLTTATKALWLDDEISAFNGQNQGKYHVTRLPLLESRDAMHAILEGKSQPTVWSPSSPVWIARLSEVWAQGHNGQRISDSDDPQDYRVLLKSPLVVLTTKAKAPFFRKVFSSATPWDTIHALSLGRKKTPWGTFRFAHADPLDASSGMLTMSLIINEYAQRHGQSGSLEQVAESPEFAGYLSELEKAFVFDPSAVGSTALEKAFENNPASRDFITAYESKAMDAVQQHPELAVVYPNPTAVADQAAVVLHGDWVSAQQREGAEAFLKFLNGPQAMQDGLRYSFRPAMTSTEVSLSQQISDHAQAGFQQSYTSIELPPYAALNEAANQWRIHVAHKSAQN